MLECSTSVVTVRECQPPKSGDGKTNDYHVKNREDNIEGKTSIDVSYWNALYGLLVVGACVLNLSILTLIPRENSIIHPEYWYEGLICVIVGVCSRHTALNLLGLYIFTKEKFLMTIIHFMKILILSSLFFGVPYCTCYVVWTLYLGRNHPLPFVGFCIWIEEVGIFWFSIPCQLWSRKNLKGQGKIYQIFQIWMFLQNLVQEMISLVATSQFQWGLIVIIPLAKISSSLVAKKIVQQISETNNEDVKFFVTTEVTVIYTSYVTGRLSSLNQITVYGLLIGEVVLQMLSCYQIIRLNTRVEENDEATISSVLMERKLKTEKLVKVEFIDAMLPLVFGVAFTLAYYGPNSGLMNDIGNDYFGGKAIKDVDTHYFAMFQMVVFDIFTMIISWLSLAYFCKINLFQAFCNMMNKYWKIFLVTTPSITLFFGLKDVNFGMDFSGSFIWITDEGRRYLIRKAVNLSEEEKLLLLSNTTLM